MSLRTELLSITGKALASPLSEKESVLWDALCNELRYAAASGKSSYSCPDTFEEFVGLRLKYLAEAEGIWVSANPVNEGRLCLYFDWKVLTK